MSYQVTSSTDLAPQSSASRFSSRAVVVGLAIAALLIIGVIVALQVFVADTIPELTEARLEAAAEKWQENESAGYDMDIDIRGAQPGKVLIEIRDGAVTAMTRDGVSPPQRTWDVWSVPGMFDTLEREMVLAEDPQHEMDVAAGTKLQLRCEFDPKYGIPRRYHRFATGAAPEIYWHVTRFVAR